MKLQPEDIIDFYMQPPKRDFSMVLYISALVGGYYAGMHSHGSWGGLWGIIVSFVVFTLLMKLGRMIWRPRRRDPVV